MNNGVILQQILVLFLMIAVGFVIKKRGVITSEANKGFSALLLKVASPFLVIASFQIPFSWELLNRAGIVFLFSIYIHLLAMLVSKLLYRRYPVAVRKVLTFAAVYSNCGFMGIPLLHSLYGSTGVFYASIYIAVYNLFVWTHGVWLFNMPNHSGAGKASGGTWKSLLNPGIISVIAGMILFIFSIRLPEPLFKALELIGSTTTPLAMLIIGASIAEVRGGELLADGAVYFSAAVRLLIIPFGTLTALKLTGIHGALLGSCTLLAAMPCAANTVLFSELYGGDSSLASRCVAISTLLSMVTLPLIMLLTEFPF